MGVKLVATSAAIIYNKMLSKGKDRYIFVNIDIYICMQNTCIKNLERYVRFKVK